MKKLYTFSPTERVLAGMFRELLQGEGVACLLRNDQLCAGLGEIPFTECYPELWVVDDELFPRAKSLLAQFMAREADGANWICPACGEEVEGQFNSCWNCGADPKPD